MSFRMIRLTMVIIIDWHINVRDVGPGSSSRCPFP
jgi:hypothetical protein